MIQRLTRRIILALLIVASVVIIAFVVTIASWLTGSGKKSSPQTAAKMQEGAELERRRTNRVVSTKGSSVIPNLGCSTSTLPARTGRMRWGANLKSISLRDPKSEPSDTTGGRGLFQDMTRAKNQSSGRRFISTRTKAGVL